MKRIIIIALLSCAFTSVKAQLNFVLNGSFEQHTNCPSEFDQIKYATYWNSIDTSWSPGDPLIPATHPGCLPEYEHFCGTLGFELPSTHWFYQYPHTGDALVQSVVYYDYGFSGVDQYNYLQGRLVNNLVAGKSYCVTFFVSRGAAAGYSINKIGAYLDDGSIDSTSHCAVPQTQYTPQVLDTNVIRDTLNWTRIQGSFVANGMEKFITLGDFFDTGNVKKIFVPGSNFGMYLFDDVSVIASDAVAYAGADTSIKPGDTARIGALVNGDGMPCWWYKLGNATAIDSGGTIKVHPSSNTTYVVKMDLCGTITYDTVTVRVWPASIDNYQLSMVNVKLYPNPATNELTVEGARGCDIVLYDAVGREMFSAKVSDDVSVINIERLARGVYFVIITDVATGERCIEQLIKQ